MDETKSTEPSEFSSPLLPIGAQGYGGNHGNDYEEKRQKETWSVPPILILTTLVAVSGSYVFGSAVGYSSPAQTGIMDDLNVGVAEVGTLKHNLCHVLNIELMREAFEAFLLALFYAVFTFWINTDNWSNDRCHYKW